jgi:hypothetical protein
MGLALSSIVKLLILQAVLLLKSVQLLSEVKLIDIHPLDVSKSIHSLSFKIACFHETETEEIFIQDKILLTFHTLTLLLECISSEKYPIISSIFQLLSVSKRDVCNNLGEELSNEFLIIFCKYFQAISVKLPLI